MSDSKSDNMPAPWTIKGIPSDIRAAATRRANQEGVNIGEFVSLALRDRIQGIRRDKQLSGPALDMQGLEQLVGLIERLSKAGCTVPENVSKNAFALLNRGLSDVKKNKPLLLASPDYNREELTSES